MGKNNNLHDFLVDVADAIREKKGTSEPINPQEFSNEIKGIESGSPFAVDFGEEIASGNAAYLNALQEDIDYYNEIQRKRANGEVTDAQLFKDNEFKYRIAWLPKGVEPTDLVDFWNLKVADLPNSRLFFTASVNPLSRSQTLQFVRCGFDDMFTGALTFSEKFSVLKSMEIDNMKCTSLSASFTYLYNMRRLSIASEVVQNFNLIVRDSVQLEHLELDMLSATSATNMFFFSLGDSQLKYAFLNNVGISIDMSSLKKLSMESIKYILDHCQTKAQPYTLTLNANVKAAFLAKCDEDAAYAASLAASNAKGLSIA